MTGGPALTRRLIITVVVTTAAALSWATLAHAQGQGKEQPPVRVGDRLVTPPDMGYFDQFMEPGPDGQMRVNAKKVMLPKAGADGQPYRNPDGSVKLFPLDDGTLPPLTPGQPR